MGDRRPSGIAAILTYLPAACAISLLPAVWRQRFSSQGDRHLAPGVIVTGLLECAVGLWVIISVTVLAGNRALLGLEHAGPLLGLAVGVEGGFRLAACFHGTILGTLPLWLLSGLHFGASHGHRAIKARGAAPDRVRKVEGGFEIDASAPKDWHETTTLEIDGTFYRLAKVSEWDDRARPYRYHLEPLPIGWLIRQVEVYELPAPDGDQSRTKV